ncbi:DNA methyltransferase [Oceanicola sp. 502str15]|uniref:site-specific DNA-methyltransferase n=1 Tax=Oceanicola sp. 502str15 TaxID=2696061 RepID=UPI00209430E6|nr:DNA methyltransferase [Oceanicola sp. 502str15]MCO6384924.1 ParB N-terminal domain-containing protein [Oceanicola sp. 502str15]
MEAVFEGVATGDLVPSLRNARTHSPSQIEQIAASIERFGFTNPVLIDEKGVIIAGHGRLAAALQLGLDQVPTIRIGYLNEPEKRALMLADNKIALNAGWDEAQLAAELSDLASFDLDFDLTITGFEVAEIDMIIDPGTADVAATPEEAPLPDPLAAAVAVAGDLWALGDHRILCGDARNPDAYARLMEGRVADACFTDPPYNVPIKGHVSGKGKVQHVEFAEACGEMSSAEFERFLAEALGLVARHSKSGAVCFACMDWRHLREIQDAGKAAFGQMLNLCVWAKTNGGMGSLYRSQHELVFVFRKGRASHRNNVQLGRYGRNRTNLWTYPGVNTFRKDRMAELTAHPTAKPVAMVQDAIRDVTARKEVVLDPFLGAGATVIAAERSGRVAYGMEIDPGYVDVILRRWRAETGQEPIRLRDHRSLTSLEADLMLEVVQ